MPLQSRRLQIFLLSFIVLCVLLWELRPSPPSDSTFAVVTATEEVLRGWETPLVLQEIEDEGFDNRLSTHSPSCQPIRPREVRGHVTAYLIMVHSEETLEGARLLVEQIYDPKDYFLIHADAKFGGKKYLETKKGMIVCGNVEFVPDGERVSVGWGDITMVDAEIAMLKRAVRAPIAWSNVIFLDGASWPVLDAVARQTWFDTFEEELRTDGEGPVPAPICSWQEDAIENETECWRTPARCLNQDCSRMTGTSREEPVRKGDQWTILTRSMVKYSVFGKEAQEWYDFFRDTAVPDEHFFATIKYAQPGAPKGWLRIPMYVDWVQPCKSHPVSRFTASSLARLSDPLALPFPQVEDNYGHPCSLGMNDYEDIKASIAMFARKILLNETELRTTMLRGEIKAVLLPPIPL
ncbi:hypothetical protein JCM5353_008252 [Sporobolomyces roseus]